jgi:hypothetical protein
VKILDMTRRLDAIADNLKDLRIEGTTRIDWNCLTERERLLFDRIVEIQDEYKPHLPPDDVLQENHALFNKGIEIIARRTIDLFRTVMKTLYITNAQEDSLVDFIFTARLFWFLHEVKRQTEQMRKEEELYEKHEGSEDFERAWKEYKDRLEDKTALWSSESFERFIHPLFERTRTKGGCKKETVAV